MSLSLRLATILSCLACSVVPARAEDDKIDCTTAMSTHELNFCADEEFQKADARLNEIYQRVLNRIPDISGDKPYDAKSFEDALRASQRAWVAFRDKDCKDLVPMMHQGGTATTGEVLGCLAEKTNARADTLRDRYLLD